MPIIIDNTPPGTLNITTPAAGSVTIGDVTPGGGGGGSSVPWEMVEHIELAGGTGFKGFDIALDYTTYRMFRLLGRWTPTTQTAGTLWFISDTGGQKAAGYQHRMNRMLFVTTSFAGTGSSGTPAAQGTLNFVQTLTKPTFIDLVLEPPYDNGDATFTQMIRGRLTTDTEGDMYIGKNDTLISMPTSFRIQVGTANQNFENVNVMVLGVPI